MKYRHLYPAALAGLALSASTLAGEFSLPLKESAPPIPEDTWHFAPTIPGWIPWMTGETVLHGLTTPIDLDPGDIVPRIDMTADVRVEASRGRFSMRGEFLYLSLSDGVGMEGLVKKVDVRMDQTMGDLGFGWRVFDGPRGWLEVTAGVRYTNIYQRLGSRRIPAGSPRPAPDWSMG